MPVVKLTPPVQTPSTLVSAFSTRRTQLPHVIPCTPGSSCSSVSAPFAGVRRVLLVISALPPRSCCGLD